MLKLDGRSHSRMNTLIIWDIEVIMNHEWWVAFLDIQVCVWGFEQHRK